jgi:hypothetical protein
MKHVAAPRTSEQTTSPITDSYDMQTACRDLESKGWQRSGTVYAEGFTRIYELAKGATLLRAVVTDDSLDRSIVVRVRQVGPAGAGDITASGGLAMLTVRSLPNARIR